MLLKDKVAIITGGAGRNGLGFATARLMAAQGARVAVLDLPQAEPDAAAAMLGSGHLGLLARSGFGSGQQRCAGVHGRGLFLAGPLDFKIEVDL